MRLVDACKRLEPRRPQDLNEEELVGLWGEELTMFWNEKVRVRRHAAEHATPAGTGGAPDARGR